MGKELTKKEQNEAIERDPTVLGACDEISGSDLSIGRIGIMQPGSEMVKEDKARQGAIVDTETEEELGYKSEKPLEFFIFKTARFWVEYKGEEFLRRIPAQHQNELPWQDGEIRRMYTHSFYIVLKKDIEEGLLMPYELSFRSTELKVARRLSKMLFLLRQQKQPSWKRCFKLTTELKKKGSYSWYGSKISLGDDATQDEMNAAYTLYKQMDSVVTVNHTGDEETAKESDY